MSEEEQLKGEKKDGQLNSSLKTEKNSLIVILSSQESQPSLEVKEKPQRPQARNSLVLTTTADKKVDLKSKRKSTLIIKTYNNESQTKNEEDPSEQFIQKIINNSVVERRGSLLYKNLNQGENEESNDQEEIFIQDL